MGVDIGGIIQHNLTKEEIINIPKVIDSWSEIRKLKKSHECCYINYGERFEKQLISNSKWQNDTAPTENTLEVVQQYFENGDRECKVNPNQINLRTFWGGISFYRNIAIIEHSPEHKYANLHYPEVAKNLLEVNREIAGKFNANKVVYYPDTSFPTEVIWEEAIKCRSIESLIKDMNVRFFEPPKSIKDAMKYFYFIDDFSDPLNDLEEWEWTDSPWIYNEVSKEYEFKLD